MLGLDTSLSATRLPEADTLTLCTYVRSLLLEESTVPVQTPVGLCGRFWDVLHLLRLCDGIEAGAGGGGGGGGGGEGEGKGERGRGKGEMGRWEDGKREVYLHG
jgi:hypothetical protein